MDVTRCPSPNFDERQLPVSMIVLHYTGMPDAEGALNRLRSPDAKVSAHYLVKEDAHFCILPKHESYQSQERVRIALQQQGQDLYSAAAVENAADAVANAADNAQ